MPASRAASSRGRPSSALASARRRALTPPPRGAAVGGVGERQQAGADPPAALAAGEAAQLGRVAVGADRQGCGHGGSSGKKASETPQAPDRSVISSSGRYYPTVEAA